MKHLYAVLLMLFVSSITLANETAVAPSATISGGATVCQNSASPVITFTGSLGTAPYTFKYQINSGPTLTVSTVALNSSVTITAPTGTAGTFTYSLISVEDSSAPPTPVTVSGSIVITVKPQPNADMNSSVTSDMFNGFPVFKECNNQATQIDFYNTSTTTSTNTSYTINWGDSSPNFTATTWTSTSHNYSVGLWTLLYTITGQNGCNITKTYKVFIGNNPAVGLGNPGNTDICITSDLTFPITGTENNPPGTTYTVTFNDGSPPVTFNHPPPPSVTHTFLIGSCGTTSTSGSTTYQNSFYASIAAINPCDQSSASVVPIRISTVPIPDFSLPQTIKCTNTQICITNTSTGGDSATSTSCSAPKLIWSISPNSGFSLASGNLGNDFNSTNINSWSGGSPSICPIFSIPGNYSITLKIGSRCGVDQIVKTICIEPPLTPLFTIPATGCVPFSMTATNNTSPANQCSPPTYNWHVTYSAGSCGTSTAPVIPDQTTVDGNFNFTEAGIYTIKLTATNSCTPAATITKTIEIKKKPTVAITTINDFCQSAMLTPVANVNTCPVNNTPYPTYLWTFPGGSPPSSPSLIAPSVTYATTGNHTVSISVENECGITTATSNTFNVLPAAIVQNETVTVCSGVAFSVTPSNTTSGNAIPTGTTYSWPSPVVTGGMTGGLAGTNQTAISGTLINPTNLPQTATYTVTPKSGTCPGATFTVVVTVNPSPVVTFTPAPQTLCSGDSSAVVTLNSATSGATFNWTAIQPAGITGVVTSGTATIPSQTLVNTTNASITITYNATATTTSSSSCSGAVYPYTITVKPNPSITESFTKTVCSSTSFTVTPAISALNSIPTGTTYSWAAPTVTGGMTGGAAGNAQTVISGTLTNPTDIAQTATYTVTPNYNGCSGAPFTVTVTVNPKPFIANITPPAICSGGTFSVTPTNGSGNIVPAGTTYTWTVSSNANVTGQAASSAGGVTTISQTLTNNSNTNQTVTYTVTPTSGSCPGASFTIIVTVNPKPSIANVTPASICSGNSFTVTPSNGSGNIVPIGTTYTWGAPISNPVGAITGGSAQATGQNSISQTLTNTTNDIATLTYTVIPLSGSCIGNSFTIVVTIKPIPATLSLTNELYCNGVSSAVITFTNAVVGTTYAWTNSNPAIGLAANGVGDIPIFTPTNTTSTSIVATITVIATANGCSGAAETFTITVNPAPTVTFSPAPQTLCSGDTSALVNLSSTITGATFSWTATQPAGITGVITSGTDTIPSQTLLNTTNAPINVTYNATATTASVSTCVGAIYPYTITVEPNPLITESFTAANCSGDSFTIVPTNSTLNSIPTGTTYSWAAPTVTGGMTGGAAGNAQNSISGTLTNPTDTAQTATYTVTPSTNGCSGATFTVTVTVNPKPFIANITPPAICSGGTFSVTPTNGSGNIVPAGTTYTWTVSSNVDVTGQAASSAGGVTTISQTLTNNSNTNQTITYTVTPTSGSCPGTSFTIIVTVNPKPFIANITPPAICSGNSFTVTPSNGSGNIVPTGITYTWGVPVSNPVGAITGGSAQATGQNSISQTLTNTTNDIATLTYTVIPLSGSCSGNPFTITVTLSPIPVVQSQVTTICSSTTFTVSPTTASGNIIPAGTTYTWTTPTVNPTGAINGANPENVPQTNISQTLINTTTSPATATYTVTPTSGVCVGTPFTVTVTVNPAINPNIVVTNNSCYGVDIASITTNITGGIPPYTITWTGPNSFTSGATGIANLEPGVYTIHIDDTGNCPFDGTYTITEPADIVITTVSENDITCYSANNGSINISVTGGTGNYVYTWTKGGNPYAVTEDLSGLAPGFYEVTVTDANNCGPKTAGFTITEPPLLVVSLVNQTNVLCYGYNTGVINVNVIGGTPNPTTLDYGYAWTGPNGFTANTQNITNLYAGTYTLTVTDNNGCQKTLSVIITQSTEIIISYTTTPITCYGANNASITIGITGGNGPYQFQWDNLATSLNQINLSAGSYTLTVTDNVGCPKSVTIVIPQAPVFMVNPIVTHVTCYGAHNGSINLNLTGGIAPVALTWSDGNPSGLIRNNLGPGTYTATISDGTPCYIVTTITIIEPQPLALSANITNAFNCTNAASGAIDLVPAGGTPPYTYSWSNGANVEDLTNLTSGNYLVTVTDSNGCTKTGQYAIVRQAPIAIAVATQTDFNCAAHTVTQNYVAQVSGGIPPYQLQWSSGTVSGANNEIMHSDINGTVVLTVTDSNGCSDTYTVTVDNPVIGYSSFDTSSYGFITYGIYAIGDPILFQSTVTGDYVSVSWDFGDGTFSTELNPSHTYAIPKDYIVTQTVTYPFGCVYVQTISLIIEKGYVLVVPTAFTPNSDNVNDTYRPVTKALKKVQLDIYDTWGSLIYTEIGDVLVGWDGKIKGFNAENGNYYSKVSAETFYGTIVNENQTFVLIK